LLLYNGEKTLYPTRTKRIYDFILDELGSNNLNLKNVELQKISNIVSQSIDKFFLGRFNFLKINLIITSINKILFLEIFNDIIVLGNGISHLVKSLYSHYVC
jgi:hypothetical protein